MSVAKVYKITSPDTPKIYIGITTKRLLCMRLSQHVFDYKRYLDNKHGYVSSYEIIKTKNYKIELIEQFTFNNKKEKYDKEKYYINLNKSIVCNIHNKRN